MALIFPWEPNSYKARVFAALAHALAQEPKSLKFVPLSFRDTSQTTSRVQEAFRRAKKQPRSALGRFLKRKMIRGQYNWAYAYFTKHPNDIAAVWNGMTGTRYAFAKGAQDAGAQVFFAEISPFAGRVTIDPAGVNFEGSVPSNPSFFDDMPEVSNEQFEAAKKGFEPRSYRVAAGGERPAKLGGKFLFCPLQVPNDSQVRVFSGGFQDLDGFVRAVAQAAEKLPDGWHIRLREHPSAKTRITDVLVPLLSDKLVLDNSTDAFEQMQASSGVVTLNSSMGLQAFFYDKPVILCGQAFYGLDGLVAKAQNVDALGNHFEQAGKVTYDAGLRRRFLHWLLTDYYPEFEGAEESADQDADRIRLHLKKFKAK